MGMIENTSQNYYQLESQARRAYEIADSRAKVPYLAGNALLQSGLFGHYFIRNYQKHGWIYFKQDKMLPVHLVVVMGSFLWLRYEYDRGYGKYYEEVGVKSFDIVDRERYETFGDFI